MATTLKQRQLAALHDTARFMPLVQRLMTAGQIDRALDVLYDGVCNLLQKEHTSAVDDLLWHIEVEQTSVHVLLALLTITFEMKRFLPSRQAFRDECERVLKERGEWEPGLLIGL